MIPVVDFSAYSLDINTSDADRSQLQPLADQVCNAFTDIGFVYLKNHGISQNKIENAFEVSKSFFCQPLENKQKYARSEGSDHGWVDFEKERLNMERKSADLKEAFNFRCTAESSMLPDDLVPDFQETFIDFFKLCRELTFRILDLMSLGLNIDPDFLRKCHRKVGDIGSLTTLRSLYYPAISNGIKEDQVRCGEHSDFGSITLLFQDDTGGLEVKPRDSDYVSAKPIPNTVLINLGDMMQRWTADKLRATEHRVLISEKERKQTRQSLAFFVTPDDDVIIECLDKSNKYPPISCIDYLNYRLSQIL